MTVSILATIWQVQPVIEVSKHKGNDGEKMRETIVRYRDSSSTHLCGLTTSAKYDHDGQHLMKEWCGVYLKMGPDFISCHAGGRPTP